MRNRYLALGLGSLVAFAVAVPALGGSPDPLAELSASAKKIAKKAKRAAKKAQKAAAAAQDSADKAQGTADSAQGSANQANSALGGVQLTRVRYIRAAADPASTTILNRKGLRLVADCTGGDLDVFARTSVANSLLASVGTDPVIDDNTTNQVVDTDFQTNESYDLVADLDDVVNGHTEYLNPNGGQVTVNWTTVNDGSGGFPDPACGFTGHVLASG
jgi:hypothetical protein